MSDYPRDTFWGDTVYTVREHSIQEQMEQEGFTTEIPSVPGVYLVVFYTRCPNKDGDKQCNQMYRNATAGYTIKDKHNAFCFVWASHWDKEPMTHLNENGVNSMKSRWNTEDIWWKLIEQENVL